ncbi:DUF6056 family protein [Butyrivibrio proteoclasticus]|uniref:DUF6056 family protein n=1 Tax=Butyrivibrio proteoclasticus TaxID=43305 RepID=UPI00047B3D77|nr:DUF6056 family protein [Butyrivibrio proteoclasticus]
MNNHKNNRIKFVLLNIFWALIIAFLSYRMPPYVDDYYHKVSFMDGAEITRISQIFPSVYTYYMTWGGRAVSMFFIQLMLMLPKWVFVICNAVIYVLVANVIYRYAVIGSWSYGGRRDDENAVIVLSAIYIMLWFFMPDFAEVVTWITGSATYLWTNLAILVFGLLYYRDFCDVDRNSSANVILISILYFILGLFAGLSNESGACTILVALAIFVVVMLRQNRKIQVYHIIGTVAAAAGAALLILAPGNSARVEAVESTTNNILMICLFRLGREGFYSIMFLGVPVIIGIGLHLVSNYVKKTSTNSCRQPIWWSIELIFYVLAFVSIFVLTFSQGFANRIFQWPLLLISIGFATSLKTILDGISDSFLGLRKSLAIVLVLLAMVALFEVVAGTLYSYGKDSFFDRQVIYYHIYDTEGVLSGNGL